MAKPERSPANFDPKTRALMVIDDRPLRNELGRELRSLYKSHAKLQKEIKHHESVVRPAYRTWYFERFGVRAQTVEKLRIDYEQKTMLLRRMRDLYTWRGYTRQKAYSQASIDLEKFKQAVQAQEEAETPVLEDEPEDIPDVEAEDILTWEAPVAEAPVDPTVVSRVREIKTYYRRLAQALHPDRLGELLDASSRQLWQETQDAYLAADLDRLKFIWTECIFAFDPHSTDVRLSDLSHATARLRAKIRSAQATKREFAKADPTWHFEKRNKEVVAREIATELVQAEADLRLTIRGLDREIKVFSGSHRHRSQREPFAEYEVGG